MGEKLLYWTRDDYSLLRHVLTSILQNPDIRLSLWRRPDDTEPAPMTPKEATINLIEIALPEHVKYEGEFDASRYYNAFYTKIRRLNKIYFMNLYPESIDQLMRSNDYKLIEVQSVWELLKELGGDSTKQDKDRVVVKSPGGLVNNSNGDFPEGNRAEAGITLTRVDCNGSGRGPPIRTETSYNLRPTKSSANLEPGPSKLTTLNTATPSVEIPSYSSDTSMIVWCKKRSTLDSEDQDCSEERKLEKAREHELAIIHAKVRLVEAEKARECDLAVINAKIRLAEAQTELARVRGIIKGNEKGLSVL